MIIKSSTALRNEYTTISDMARDSEEPIYITKNGEGDLVVTVSYTHLTLPTIA